MNVHIIEATQDVKNGFNHGKFMVCTFTREEWEYRCRLDAEMGLDRSLLIRCGWGPRHLWVLDLQTGEGALLRHGGFASADLERHKVWVCPLFEPFLEWLYQQDPEQLAKLPALVELPAAEGAMYGYRRPGKRRRANGTGSVYQRSDGRWCAAVTFPWGREVRYEVSEEKAEERRMEMLAELRRIGLKKAG